MLNNEKNLIQTEKKNKKHYEITIKFCSADINLLSKKTTKILKTSLSDYEILWNLLYFKNSFFTCRQDDMNLLLFFKQPSFFNTYTMVVDFLKHIQQTGLLPSAIHCAVFVTFQIVPKLCYCALGRKRTLKAQSHFHILKLLKSFYCKPTTY